LDGRPAGLHLPAGEIGTVIRKDQSEISHVLFGVLRRLSLIVNCYDSICSSLPPPLAEGAAARQLYYFTNDQFTYDHLLTADGDGKECLRHWKKQIARNSCPSFYVLATSGAEVVPLRPFLSSPIA
jgi:hypothetical protein